MPTIRQNLTNVNYNPRGTRPLWIVVHNTANYTSREGTAYNNTVYFKDVYRSASAHYFVDDGDTIWQCVRDTDTAWHCGEAASRNGCFNNNSIGIEVCENADGSFTENEIETLSWLVQQLMEAWDIPASRVCRHYDVTGKDCPRGYIDSEDWQALKERITDDMPSANEIASAVWSKDIHGMEAGERIYASNKAEYDRKDYSGRGKDGVTPFERLTYMAAKQEKMQADIDELNMKLDAIIAELSK